MTEEQARRLPLEAAPYGSNFGKFGMIVEPRLPPGTPQITGVQTVLRDNYVPGERTTVDENAQELVRLQNQYLRSGRGAVLAPSVSAPAVASQAGFPLAGQAPPPVALGAPAPAVAAAAMTTPAEWIRNLAAGALPSREAAAATPAPPASPGMAALQRGAVLPTEQRKAAPNFYERAMDALGATPPPRNPNIAPRG